MQKVGRRLLDAVVEVFGSRNYTTVALLLLLLMLTHGAAADVLHHLVYAGGKWAPLVLFLLVVGLCLLLARPSEELKLDITTYKDLEFRRRIGLILFLSPAVLPGQSTDEETIKNGLTAISDAISNLLPLPSPRPAEQIPPGILAALCLSKHTWRMPLEAIWFHVQENTLRQVVVICSPESKPYREQFEKIVAAFCKRVNSDATVSVRWASDIGPRPYSRGFNFEDADELKEAINRSVKTLEDEGLSGDKFVIDVTGGQKLSAVLGAAHLLQDRGRSFQ